MKRIFLQLLLAFSAVNLWANDGVYFVTGNQLVPLQETQISVSKEVLTVTFSDAATAEVDVQYEFYNNGPEKTVLMGFEANPSYNDDYQIHTNGVHPHILDFTVNMNGQDLSHKNCLGLIPEDQNSLVQYKMGDWKVFEDEENGDMPCLKNVKTGETKCEYAYIYYFNATFKPGLNKVHHTYRYTISYSVGQIYHFDYALKPAGRWAGGKIGDFTLRINVPKTAKHFCLGEPGLANGDFKVVSGFGKTRRSKMKYEEGTFLEVVLRDGVLEYKQKDYKPESNLSISSLDMMYIESDGYKLGCYYDRSDRFSVVPLWGDYAGKPVDKRILRNLPYANRGYVFKDAKLKKYFSQFWWYMPDPNYTPSTADFTRNEQKYIKGITNVFE